MAHDRDVITRTLTSILWFVAVWMGAGVVTLISGAPEILALVAAVAAGLLIWSDPMHWLWLPRPDRKQIRRRIADLERVSPSAPAAATMSRQEPAAD